MCAVLEKIAQAPRGFKEDGSQPDRSDAPAGRARAEKEPQRKTDDRKLVCKQCRLVITRPDLAMEIDGSHRHVFFNPHGFVFDIACFASAKNLSPTGPRTDEFTWFPGYTWQAVSCTGCSSLLGWRYSGKESGFYGLITSALMEVSNSNK